MRTEKSKTVLRRQQCTREQGTVAFCPRSVAQLGQSPPVLHVDLATRSRVGHCLASKQWHPPSAVHRVRIFLVCRRQQGNELSGYPLEMESVAGNDEKKRS